MVKFHTLHIKDIRKETEDCVSIAFDVPASLKENFRYKQGQYLTLRSTVDNEDLRRSYSICSSPANGDDMRIAVKKVENGRFSGFLNEQIKIGQEIQVMEPMGNFYTEMPSPEARHYVAFVAGSGITPVMSLLKTALLTETQSKFTLFYGNRELSSIIFKDELDRLLQKYPGRLEVHHILSREEHPDPLYSGRIDAAKCKEIINAFPGVDKADAYFLCGPLPMIETISESLEQHGVEKKKIHFELFTTETPAEVEEKTATATGNTIIESEATVILDGDETEVHIPKGKSILNSVLDAGLDAPFACTGGSCCTCRAKLIKGHVIMDVNYALTEDEVEEGYILTCQSHPTTPSVVVDYDAP